MARCIKHIPCPQCRSKGKDKHGDNLGVYEDGSFHCFSCGYHPKSIQSARVGQYLCKRGEQTNKSSKLYTPTCSSSIARIGHRWLDKFDITASEIEQYKIKWCEEHKSLVFPFYNDRKELIFYQEKFFEGEKRWKSYGTKPLVFLGNSDPIVLVEDIISAIKVARVATAVPLFGSSITIHKLKQIKNAYKKSQTTTDKSTADLFIWLDYDKATIKETKKAINEAKIIFEETKQIVTEKDPKAYSAKEIKSRISSI